MTRTDLPIYTIQSASGQTRMQFMPQLGGLGTSLIVTVHGIERELLYFPEHWSPENHVKMCGGFPFIFPICGRLRRGDMTGCYLYHHKIYKMPIHGFAHRLPWQVTCHQQDRIVMSLTENEMTLKEYPFAFKVQLDYEMTENQLICRHIYHNTGDTVLPYYGGFHPYFLLPDSKDRVQLAYFPQSRLLYNSDLTDIVGETAIINTPCPVSTPLLNESLVRLTQNKNVRLNFADQTGLTMQVRGETDPDLYSYIQLYHIPAEPFLCIEPWMSHPNAMNTLDAARSLQPGAREHAILKLTYF